MPKYFGSSQDVRTPLMRASAKTHTPEQINDWWNTLANGVKEDIHISRDLNQESHTLFFLNDNGVLTPALHAKEDLSDSAVRNRMLDQSRAGRLFVRGLDDDYPRQIITDDQYQMALTAPTNTLPAVEGNLPAKPRRPFFLKFLLALVSDSYKEEIDNYNAKKERYDQAVQRREMVQNFRENVKKTMTASIKREADDPSIAARKEVRAKALEDAWEAKKAKAASQQEAAEKNWMNNPSRETLSIFENHLRDICIKDFSLAAEGVLKAKGPASEYYKNLAQMLEKQFALPLLEQLDECTTNADREKLLLQNQNDYIKMMKDMKLLAPSLVNRERLNQFLQLKDPTFAQTNEMHQEIKMIKNNGLQAYQNLNPMKPEQQQMQQPQQQMQMKGPEAAAAAQVPKV